MGANPEMDFAGMIWENAIALSAFGVAGIRSLGHSWATRLQRSDVQGIGDRERLRLGFGFGAERSPYSGRAFALVRIGVVEGMEVTKDWDQN